jgi:integrase
LQRRRFALLRREWQLSLYPQAAEAGGCLVTMRSGESARRDADPERASTEANRRARAKIRRYGAANRLNRHATLTYAGKGCHRHAEAAGLVGIGMTSGLNMHRARHTFATDLRRVADIGAASQALGHSDLSTTAAIYGHYDLTDLERAMDALARSRREREEPAD